MFNSNKQCTCIFFKYILLLWSLFDLLWRIIKISIYLSIYLLCLVNKNVGACTYIKDRRLPSESMYMPVYMCVFNFFCETTGPMKPSVCGIKIG